MNDEDDKEFATLVQKLIGTEDGLLFKEFDRAMEYINDGKPEKAADILENMAEHLRSKHTLHTFIGSNNNYKYNKHKPTPLEKILKKMI